MLADEPANMASPSSSRPTIRMVIEKARRVVRLRRRRGRGRRAPGRRVDAGAASPAFGWDRACVGARLAERCPRALARRRPFALEFTGSVRERFLDGDLGHRRRPSSKRLRRGGGRHLCVIAATVRRTVQPGFRATRTTTGVVPTALVRLRQRVRCGFRRPALVGQAHLGQRVPLRRRSIRFGATLQRAARTPFLGLGGRDRHAFGLKDDADSPAAGVTLHLPRLSCKYEGEKHVEADGRSATHCVGRRVGLWNPIDRFNAIPPLAIEADQSPGHRRDRGPALADRRLRLPPVRSTPRAPTTEEARYAVALAGAWSGTRTSSVMARRIPRTRRRWASISRATWGVPRGGSRPSTPIRVTGGLAGRSVDAPFVRGRLLAGRPLRSTTQHRRPSRASTCWSNTCGTSNALGFGSGERPATLLGFFGATDRTAAEVSPPRLGPVRRTQRLE